MDSTAIEAVENAALTASESKKLGIADAIALLRSNFISYSFLPPPLPLLPSSSASSPPKHPPSSSTSPPPPPPPPSSSASSPPPAYALCWNRKAKRSRSLQRWKHKAKLRKLDILRLQHHLNQALDTLRSDLYPQTASCKCYFFSDLERLGCKQLNDDSQSVEKFSDVLRRRFLRQVRLHGIIKKTTNNSTQRRGLAEFYREDGTEQLKLSADFLADLCDTPCPAKRPHFANQAHQAVEFILGSLSRVLLWGKDLDVIEEVISNLIAHLVKRMCTLLEDELYGPETGTQIHIQHILRTLARVSYFGQRVLFSVSHRISELAERLLFLDPFDESFALIHDTMFLMIQLIEFLVTDYLVSWSKEECFNTILFEEWVASFLDARKALQLLERRSGIYALYMDRVTGELARQVVQVPSLQKLNQDIVGNLFS